MTIRLYQKVGKVDPNMYFTVSWFVYCVQDAAAIQLENNYDVFLDDDNFEMINLDPFRATWINLYQS